MQQEQLENRQRRRGTFKWRIETKETKESEKKESNKKESKKKESKKKPKKIKKIKSWTAMVLLLNFNSFSCCFGFFEISYFLKPQNNCRLTYFLSSFIFM